MQCWVKKFCKDQSLEHEERSGPPSEVDSDQLRALIEAGHLTTMQEVAEELSIDSFMDIQYLKQIGRGEKAQ